MRLRKFNDSHKMIVLLSAQLTLLVLTPSGAHGSNNNGQLKVYSEGAGAQYVPGVGAFFEPYTMDDYDSDPSASSAFSSAA